MKPCTPFLPILRILPLLLLLSPAPAAEEAPAPTPSPAKVVDLRVESQTNPTAVNNPLPRFSWRIETEERGWFQKTYHILAASTPELLAQDKGDLWDSGETPSRSSQFIPFGGSPLTTGQEIHWKVRITDLKRAALSPWSAPARFAVVLTEPAPLPQPLFLPDAPRLSSFECSDPKLNDLYEIAATRLHEIDNPRDVGFAMRAAAYHQKLFPRAGHWLNHLSGSVDEAGIYPAKLPSDGSFSSIQSDAVIYSNHALWWMTGHSAVLDRHMPLMNAYVTLRSKIDPTGIESPFGDLPSDVLPTGDPTPTQFVHLTSQATNLRLMIEMGSFSVKTPYAKQALQQAQLALSEPFRTTYLKGDGTLKFESLPADLMALRCGLLSDNEKAAISRHAFGLLASQSGQALFSQSPIVAYNLLPVLSWTGHSDRALELARTLDAKEASPLAIANTSEWLISFLTGMGARTAGWQHIVLTPYIAPENELKFAKAHFDSSFGRVSTHWRHEEGTILFDVTVPPNTTAFIQLPTAEGDSLTESGNDVASTPEFLAFKRDDHTSSFSVLSGTYHFLIGK